MKALYCNTSYWEEETLTTKDFIELPIKSSTLPPYLLEEFTKESLNVGVLLLVKRFFPLIHNFLWVLSSFHNQQIVIGDFDNNIPNEIKSQVCTNIKVIKKLDEFNSIINDLDVIVGFSDSGLKEENTPQLLSFLIFPPFNPIHPNFVVSKDIKNEKQIALDDCNYISRLFAEIIRKRSQSPLQSKQVIITAGPTQGPIDAVRFISSTSTGALGSIIADKLYLAGCEVRTIIGKGSKHFPKFCPYQLIRTPQELQQIIEDISHHIDIFVFSAAVLDYVPKAPSEFKTPSGLDKWIIELKKTPKIIQIARERNPEAKVVEFKLLVNISDEKLLQEAKKRLEQSQIIVANDLQKVKENTHEAIILTKSSQYKVKKKKAIAGIIQEELEQLYM